MFGWFSNSSNESPVPEENRLWLDEAFLWLLQTFDKEKIKDRKILVPHYSDFPIKYNGQHQTALDTLKIVATQMEVNPNEINLDIYAEAPDEIKTGGLVGSGRIFMQQAKDEKYSGGLYWGKREDNKYHIGLEEKKLKEPIDMVATLAHEISHIKLLGEKRIEKNNEPLTDLTTIIFGLGVFNANAAFQTKRGVDSWGWSKLGYLSQMEWGYALALFSHIREEQNPKWAEFLTPNVKSDYKKSLNFIAANPDKIFQPSNSFNE